MAAGRLFPLLCAAADSRARDGAFMTWIHWPPRQQLANQGEAGGKNDNNTHAGGVLNLKWCRSATKVARSESKQKLSSHPCRLLSALLRIIAAMVFTLGDKSCLWRHACHGGRGQNNKGVSRQTKWGQGRERWGRWRRNIKQRQITRAKNKCGCRAQKIARG